MKYILIFLLLLLSVGASAFADTVILTWTATGDNGNEGRASEYDLRYSSSPITAENFYQATRVEDMLPPQAPGTKEVRHVSGLTPGTVYYFALKVGDEAGNWSPMAGSILGVACREGCIGITGNINGDPNDDIDIVDAVHFINYMFNISPAYEPHCMSEADIDGSGEIDVSDLVQLLDYMFRSAVSKTPAFCR